MWDFFPRGRMQNYILFQTGCEELIQRLSPDLELAKTRTMARASSTALKSATLVNFPNKWFRLVAIGHARKAKTRFSTLLEAGLSNLV
jgi:hypothetical protein